MDPPQLCMYKQLTGNSMSKDPLTLHTFQKKDPKVCMLTDQLHPEKGGLGGSK